MTPTTKAALDAAEKALNVAMRPMSQSTDRSQFSSALLLIAEARKADETRYFLSSDGSGHWFYIPVSRRPEWNVWRDLHEDDERSWTSPDYATPINMHPAWITFTNPEMV